MRSFLLCVLLWSVSLLPLHAGQTVQIQLEGNAGAGGSWVEIELDGLRQGANEPTRVRLNLYFGTGTGGADVMAVLQTRLVQANWTYSAAPAPSGQPASLTLAAVERVLVRTGGGIRARLTVCDGVPSSLGVLTPLGKSADAEILVEAVQWNQRMRERGRLSFRAPLKVADGAIGAAQSLLTATGKASWISETPTRETWRLANSMEGIELTGASFSLSADPQSDWGLELKLPRAP